jgi:hypothetical protein
MPPLHRTSHLAALVLSAFSLATPLPASAIDFRGHAGLYVLGATDVSVGAGAMAHPAVAGATVRVLWPTLEFAPGRYDWSFVDGEIALARSANKKISLAVLGDPAWIRDSLHAQTYSYLDRNPNHPTFGDTLFGYVPWDPVYVARIGSFLDSLGARYANEPVVSYCNVIAGNMSRGMPDTLADGRRFFQAYPYDADTIVARMIPLLDRYMALFPNTPLWTTVDYVTFEPNASGRARNYLATQYVNHGVAHYPDRFGVWREDLAGCNPPANVSAGSQWAVMLAHPERTGAQMLWNVQDGPARMNKCGIAPNTKAAVLDSAIAKGEALGMRYFEIYRIDVLDASLTGVLTDAKARLDARFPATTGVAPLADPGALALAAPWPNPARGAVTVRFSLARAARVTWAAHDLLGRRVAHGDHGRLEPGAHAFTLPSGTLAPGVYALQVAAGAERRGAKLVVAR